ncbi:MAG: insulinase family protein [Muribaculaceae bacterium]|nr:insulinase family protein [Muribaculaceae bacterium]
MAAPDRSKAPQVYSFAPLEITPDSVELLSPGKTLHFLRGGDQQLARLTLMWEGGTLETPRNSLSTFVIEDMREGTPTHSGADIADAIDFAGARLTPRISEHYTGVDLLAISSRLPDLLPLIYDMAVNAVYSPETVAVTARKLAGALSTKMARVAYPAACALQAAMTGPDHRAALTELPQQIADTTRDDVLAARNTIIGNGRLHAFLTGNFDDSILGAVRELVKSFPAASAQSPISLVPYSPSAPSRLDLPHPGALQAAVAMGIPTIGRNHPDYIPLRLAVIALGGYFSSRLMTNIREEKGLTYGINASLLGTLEGASMRISAQCDKANVEQVIDETRAEIRSLVTAPPSGDELHRLKLNAWTSLAATVDSPLSMMNYYITALDVGTGDDYFARQLKVIESLSPDDIARVAEAYLDVDKLSVVTCGAVD